MHTYIFMHVLLINQVLCPKEDLLGKYSLFTLIIFLKVKGDKKFCMNNRGTSTMIDHYVLEKLQGEEGT